MGYGYLGIDRRVSAGSVLRDTWGLIGIVSGLQVTLEMVNVVYEYGQCQYQCGNYSTASDLLYHFRILVRVSGLCLGSGEAVSSYSDDSLPITTRQPPLHGESSPVRFF